MDNVVVEENNVSPKKVDSLVEFVSIKKISPINESLWCAIEMFKKRNIEMDIIFENPEKEVVEKGPVKSRKIGTAAFTSISLMVISTSIATAAIIVLGVLLTR